MIYQYYKDKERSQEVSSIAGYPATIQLFEKYNKTRENKRPTERLAKTCWSNLVGTDRGNQAIG